MAVDGFSCTLSCVDVSMVYKALFVCANADKTDNMTASRSILEHFGKGKATAYVVNPAEFDPDTTRRLGFVDPAHITRQSFCSDTNPKLDGAPYDLIVFQGCMIGEPYSAGPQNPFWSPFCVDLIWKLLKPTGVFVINHDKPVYDGNGNEMTEKINKRFGSPFEGSRIHNRIMRYWRKTPKHTSVKTSSKRRTKATERSVRKRPRMQK